MLQIRLYSEDFALVPCISPPITRQQSFHADDLFAPHCTLVPKRELLHNGRIPVGCGQVQCKIALHNSQLWPILGAGKQHVGILPKRACEAHTAFLPGRLLLLRKHPLKEAREPRQAVQQLLPHVAEYVASADNNLLLPSDRAVGGKSCNGIRRGFVR